MKKTQQHKIPTINFLNQEQKPYGFSIITNKDLLVDNPPTDYNPFRSHRLNYYAILFIRKGSGQHFIDFKQYTYKPGSVIFIAKEQVHAFEWNSKRDAYFILFTAEFLERSTLGSGLMQQLSLYHYHVHHPIMQLKRQQRSLFAELVARMKEEHAAPGDWLTEEIIASSLRIFLSMAERIRQANLPRQPRSAFHEPFIRLHQLLNQHVLTSRQVQFYANAMNISTKQLNRITREIVQKPAKSYISEILILELKRLLMNTSLSIKEISYRSGFDEATNFVKYFKKQTGHTPTDFRKVHWHKGD